MVSIFNVLNTSSSLEKKRHREPTLNKVYPYYTIELNVTWFITQLIVYMLYHQKYLLFFIYYTYLFRHHNPQNKGHVILKQLFSELN